MTELQSVQPVEIPEIEHRVTISAAEMPLGEFVRWLSNESGVSIVVEERLDNVPISIDVNDQGVSEVLGVVARRAGVEVNRSGSLYYIGSLRREDRGVLVRRVRRLSGEEITEAVRTLLSEFGQVVSFRDGLVVVGDRVEVLQRIHELFDSIEAADNATWVVQLYVVSMTYAEQHELGFDVEPALDIAVTFAATSTSGIDVTGALEGGLGAILKAAHGRESVHIMAEPLFYLGDGEVGSFVRGEGVPVPERTVSPEGTVSTVGYEIIQTGLTVDVGLREVSADAARLEVAVDVSDIRGFIEEAPIVASETFTTTCHLTSGGVYLLGSVERDTSTRGRSGGFYTGSRSDQEATLWQVWARAFRVGSPVR